MRRCPQDHLPAPAAAVEVDPRGHGARQRARRQHRHLHAQRIRHQLEQGHRSVSTFTIGPSLQNLINILTGDNQLYICEVLDRMRESWKS